MMPDICFLILAHVRHILQNFGTCTYGAVPSRVLTASPLEPVTLSPKILIFSTPPPVWQFSKFTQPLPLQVQGETLCSESYGDFIEIVEPCCCNYFMFMTLV